MGFGGPNPGIWGDSVRKALNADEERNAHDRVAGAEQQVLDKAELQDLERTGVYGETTETGPPSRRRGFLARLFRRSA